MPNDLPHSVYTIAHIGDHVRHPLYPELGTGIVLTASPDDLSPGVRVGRIHWATGQETAHNLGILRIIDGDTPNPRDRRCPDRPAKHEPHRWGYDLTNHCDGRQ